MFFEKMMNAYWSKKAGNKKGFTLVEMLVVVAIVAALVSIVIPVFGASKTKAAAATNAANLRATKGAFTTLKLMNPEDYTAWTGGVVAITGVEAKEEQFIVSANPNANKAKSAAGPLAVEAKNAVEMKDGNTFVAKDTPMNAQIIKDEDGDEEVYVTYNDLPIAYFAAVAEFGTANPNDYKKTSTNTAAAGAWVDKLTNWGKEIAENAADQKVLGASLYGNLITQMTDIMKDTASQGDCLECAMNNVNTNNAGVLGMFAGDKVDKLLATKGYEASGYDPNKKDETSHLKAYCAAYSPKDASGACVCSTAKNAHGPEAHVSKSNSLGIGEGMEACSAGGVHSLNHDHKCTKCEQLVHVTNGKPDHNFKSSMPYMDTLLEGTCIYCNYCPCCALTGPDQEYTVFNENFSIFNAVKKQKFPYGYQVAKINYEGIEARADAGVCMATDPVMGGGKAKGCGHSLAAHRE